MSRGVLFFWACAPVALVLACGQPFSATSDESAAGAGDVSDGARGGAPGLGGHGVVSKPLTGGSASLGGDDAVDTGGAFADVMDGAGAPAAGAAPVVVGANGCPELGGEKLVLANGFCIDENEVTSAHYQAFVDSHPSVALQPVQCASNTTFANNCKATEPEKQPQRCADWCDARAYCASVGKRLCGSTESGGSMPYDAPVISTDNQWYSACSHVGEVAYPYGNDYDSAACWGADRPPVGALTVKSASGCVGGYAGLWDMSGGLAEWVDSCNGNAVGAACHIRGGSFSGTSEQLRCDWESAAPRDTSSNYIGFRCCADVAAR